MNGFRCDLRGSELLPETPTTIHYAQFYRCSIIIIIMIIIIIIQVLDASMKPTNHNLSF